jgi:hypothetical protein
LRMSRPLTHWVEKLERNEDVKAPHTGLKNSKEKLGTRTVVFKEFF